MRFRIFILASVSFFFVSCFTTDNSDLPEKFQRKTEISIKGEKFYINEIPTYKGRTWNGIQIEGLLFNSRMVQGIFDDFNPETRELWAYPDTKKWDPDRNTDEFVKAMDGWYSHGLLAFTINLQGGSPVGYGNSDWYNSAFTEEGDLRQDYMMRLEKILNKADETSMVVVLGIFYFGQDQNLRDEDAVINAVDEVIGWLSARGYRNVIIEVNNECNVRRYDHEILKPGRVHELIERIKNYEIDGIRFLTGTSYGGNFIPLPNVVKVSDFILIHGNGVKDPDRITEMVEETRKVEGYKPMPVLFNEDDHYDFDKLENNMTSAVKAYASWGFFDYRREGEAFIEGYQCPPVDWGINSLRKKGFFNKLKEITGY